MKLGFSLSPGGLLLPYHLGALASLAYHGILNEDTPIAGSSAGAIAVASHAAQVPSHQALEASMKVSSSCNPLFLASGGLMPRLRLELYRLLGPDAHQTIQERPGLVGLAHLQVYPKISSQLETEFNSEESLVNAICDSSMFPYFTSNRPWNVYMNSGLERTDHNRPKQRRWNRGWSRKSPIAKVTMDGVFTEPAFRFGCPDIRDHVDREIKIMVCPQELPNLLSFGDPSSFAFSDDPQVVSQLDSSRFHSEDVIAPKLEHNVMAQASKLGLMAVGPAPRKTLASLYEAGFCDAERWVRKEESRNS
ncbi:unnamed protein product [Cylindrotheca closterium]|uniref:PNPLA domain-containing protein n=1 Tax=Cylindrotheca closterium TaxID=2856 RepID=A0AAD2FQF6_9STRA|nr:unnamed protein product [Cylindrotheca closterium]